MVTQSGSFEPTDPGHTVADPLRVGFVAVSGGRHRNPSGTLSGAPKAQCILNDPTVVQAEYVYPDRQSAEAARDSRGRRWGLPPFRQPTFEAVPVVVHPAPDGSVGPSGAFANAHHYFPPQEPDLISQQYGMLWATANWQGVETAMPTPPPDGSEQRWACVFLVGGTVVRIRR